MIIMEVIKMKSTFLKLNMVFINLKKEQSLKTLPLYLPLLPCGAYASRVYNLYYDKGGIA